jgi:hypothetical protein
MKLAIEPDAGQAALERALRALTRLVCTRHAHRPDHVESAVHSGLVDPAVHGGLVESGVHGELLELAQDALWLAVEEALQGAEAANTAGALFPSLQRWPGPRRAELLADLASLQHARAKWRTEPSRPVAREVEPNPAREDEVGMALTQAAHAAGLEALAAWVCGPDALDELELALTGLLASVGVIEDGAAAAAAPSAAFAAWITRSRMLWSGPAPKPAQPGAGAPQPGVPAPGADRALLAHEPARFESAARVPAHASGGEPRAEAAYPTRRERRMLRGASLGVVALLGLAVLAWILSERSTREALRLPGPVGVAGSADPSQQLAPVQGRVRIYSRPTRAELYLDGRFIGLTPLELERDQANGSLRLSLDGYPELRQEIDLRHSTSSVLVLELGTEGAANQQ